MRPWHHNRRCARVVVLALALLLALWLLILVKSGQTLHASLRAQQENNEAREKPLGSAKEDMTLRTSPILRASLAESEGDDEASQNDLRRAQASSKSKPKTKVSYIPPDHHKNEAEGDLGKAHIFYYSWWGSPDGVIEKGYAHWNHAVLPHWEANVNERFKSIIGKVYQPPDEIGANFYPADGPYSSSNQATIERHAQEIQASGASVVVLSWYPPGKSDSNGVPELADQLTLRLLDAFGRHGLKLAFHIEPYAGRSASSVWSDAEYISLRYGAHPALAKVKDKPLLYIYDSYLIPKEQWHQTAVDKGMKEHKNACYFGLVVERHHLEEIAFANGFFDGIFTYFAADGFVWGSTRSSWKELVSSAKSKGLMTSISVGPGYIDTKIRPWNGVNIRARDAGEYYRQSFHAAADAKPDFVSITSYNEWHEGTQIEPAIRKDGYEDYRDALREANLKNILPELGSKDEPGVYIRLTARFINDYFG